MKSIGKVFGVKRKEKKYIGCIDSIDKGNVNGWVVNNENKHSVVKVGLWIDGKVVARMDTSVIRKDVAWTHGCHEYAGFSIPIPIDRIENGTFSYEVIVEDEPAYSIPTISNIKVDMASIVNMPDQLFDMAKLKNSLVSELGEFPGALIRLNNCSNVRLTNIDPTLSRIHIINGAKGSSSELFRTYAISRALREIGISSLIYSVEDIPYLPIGNIDACIFVRVAATHEVVNYVKALKGESVKIISDFDDLVFRPSLLHKIDGVRYLSEDEKTTYAFGMMQYREMLRISDQVWVTTERLAKEVSVYNSNITIINNFPLQQAREAASDHPKNMASGGFVIGYYSGTLTHQADFRVCYNPILDFLDKYKDARLRLVGKIDLSEFPELDRSGQVDKVGLLDYASMIKNMAECSVVIAPLVIGDDFCECKSELKYFDAALSYVPIIASGTAVFNEIIKHGNNGFIAKTERDWFDCLDDCYRRPRLLKSVAIAAHNSVKDKYSFSRQVDVYRNALISLSVLSEVKQGKSKALNVRLDIDRPRKRLAVLLPDIMIGSGGHRKVLTFCSEYSLRGGDVEVCFISDKTDGELKEIVEKYYFQVCGKIRAYRGIQPNADVFVATSWPTAYIVDRWDGRGDKFYFVQDFEPMFNAVSTDYALAYNSYRLNLNIIPFGRWNASKLKAEFGYDLIPVDFPVDSEVYYNEPIERSKNTILFYARPSQPRRLYELGHSTMLALRSYLPSWSFVYYGEDIRNFAHQGIKCIGKKTVLGDLRELYSNATLGLAFSTTNPSLIPFEMLACGLPLVDVLLARENPDFDGCESIVYSNPTVDELSETIFKLAIDQERLALLSEKAINWSKLRPSESQFASSVIGRLGLA